MKNTALVAVASVLLGGAAGYVVGNSGESTNHEAAENSGVTRTSRSTKIIDGGASGQNRRAARTYEQIMAEPSQTNRIQGLVDLYANMDPALFPDEVAKLDDLPMSERLLASFLLFSAWGESDPIAAMEHANSQMGMAGNFVKPSILQSWASSDPVNAAKYYEVNKGEFRAMNMFGRGRGRDGQSPAATIAAEWAKQDPSAALAWAQGLEGSDSTRASASVLGEIAKSDPSKAANMAGSLEESVRAEAYQSIASEWARADWNATEAWLNTLSGNDKDSATISALRSLSSIDPTLAAQKVAALPEGQNRDRVTSEVAGALARENPQNAMKWLESNASENAQNRSVREVVSTWAMNDPKGARDWINNQEMGSVRDSAVQTYLFTSSDNSPQDAVTMAQTISDDRSRERTVRMTMNRWMQEDKEAATQYIQQSPNFSPEMKEQLQNPQNRGGRGGRGGRR